MWRHRCRRCLAVTLHVSVWVEIVKVAVDWINDTVTLHVSVWVEILIHLLKCSREPCHAPRERVSWNAWNRQHHNHSVVTLHVSVWVEIFLSDDGLLVCAVTLHVSVWVEIFQRKRMGKGRQGHAPRERVSWNAGIDVVMYLVLRSRSKWACELKFSREIVKLA